MDGDNFLEILFNEKKCTGCKICQLWCSFIFNEKFAPSKAFIQIIEDYDGVITNVMFLEGCTQCGQCARHCLYGALELKEGDN